MLTTIYLLRLSGISEVQDVIVTLLLIDSALAGIVCGSALAYVVGGI